MTESGSVTEYGAAMQPRSRFYQLLQTGLDEVLIRSQRLPWHLRYYRLELDRL
jgi:hypothetical protein